MPQVIQEVPPQASAAGYAPTEGAAILPLQSTPAFCYAEPFR
jgi:hypothetical protein